MGGKLAGASTRTKCVLVVDDDAGVRALLVELLERAGYTVAQASSGAEAIEKLHEASPALIISGVQMAGGSGYEVCRTLRRELGRDVPFIFLSGTRTEPYYRVAGFEFGADDYMTKPFDPEELLARVRALLRRGRPADVFRLKAADLELDVVARRALRGERALELTVREFELLEYLLRHQGRLVSREMLAREVWKEPHRATPIDNVIDVQMARLRKKVDADGQARLIHTVRGVGFMLRDGEP